jgi:hypothetical protein
MLYRRYAKAHLTNGQLRSQDFRPLPGVSVNRQKYSNSPRDVLHVDCAERNVTGWGILDFRVDDVTSGDFGLEGAQDRFEFYLKHDPKKMCKAHSEIFCRNTETKLDVEPSKRIRNLFRIALSLRLNVILKAVM